MTPTPDAIRVQLDRILAAATFAGTGRHGRLLRYLVERTLAGEGARLKEYTLATEVFERPDTYDPRLDSLVRVEMRRLRTRLQDYYSGPGAGDAVRISVPRGSYAPEFSVRVAPTARDEGRTEAAAPHRQAVRVAWLALGAGVGVALLVTVLQLQDRAATAHAVTGPAIAVLPFESYSTAPEDQLLAARLTDAVTSELAKVPTVSVVSRTTMSLYARDARAVRELATSLGVQFVVEASAVADGDRLRAVVRLVDTGIDRKVWVGQYDLAPSEIAGGAAGIASDAAAAAVAYGGTPR